MWSKVFVNKNDTDDKHSTGDVNSMQLNNNKTLKLRHSALDRTVDLITNSVKCPDTRAALSAE